VSDSPDAISETILEWTKMDDMNIDLILTTGGTGFGPRDYTPETVAPLLHRPAPGIAQSLLQEG
jgi:molybdopterin biosynthesis enzyme MoaB